MSKFKNIENKNIEIDGKLHWLSRSVAVVATVLLNNEKVLIVKRGYKTTQPGKWCNPCGYLDWNESSTQASIREIWEETGLDITEITDNPDSIIFESLIHPWDIVTNHEINDNQDIALYHGISFTSDIEPEIHNKNCEEGEIDEVKWVSINDLDKYEFAFNHDKRILKYIRYTLDKDWWK